MLSSDPLAKTSLVLVVPMLSRFGNRGHPSHRTPTPRTNEGSAAAVAAAAAACSGAGAWVRGRCAAAVGAAAGASRGGGGGCGSGGGAGAAVRDRLVLARSLSPSGVRLPVFLKRSGASVEFESVRCHPDTRVWVSRSRQYDYENHPLLCVHLAFLFAFSFLQFTL
jgi:hypothetical protein